MNREGHLVYVRESITELSVEPARLAIVVCDLDDTVIVQTLDSETLERTGDPEELGDEQVIEIVNPNGSPATVVDWQRS